jgi:hypothetical protein
MTTANEASCSRLLRRVGIGLLCAAVIAIALPQAAVPRAAASAEECESALGNLIAILESKSQLSGTRYIYSGDRLGSDYSKCRVSSRKPSWPRYAVYRSNDNLTVVVEKQLRIKKAPVFYGPFTSAYRK